MVFFSNFSVLSHSLWIPPYPPLLNCLSMLKRTIGRSLLAMLVITGLAGTVNNDSLSKAERKYAVNLMKDTKEEVLGSVRGLSAAQLDFKSRPDQWSVKECMYHIAVSEKNLWEMFETSMKGPANPEKRKEIKFTDEQIVNMMKDRTSKFKTFPNYEPASTGYESFATAMDDFKKTRTEHIRHIKSSTEDMRNHVVQMGFGPIDCYQLCLMIASHTNRHVQQINEMKASQGFPAK